MRRGELFYGLIPPKPLELHRNGPHCSTGYRITLHLTKSPAIHIVEPCEWNVASMQGFGLMLR